MNWNSTEFVWLDWTVLAIGVIGVIWAVWHAIVKDRKAQKGEDSSAYLFGKGEPWYVYRYGYLRSQHRFRAPRGSCWYWCQERCRYGSLGDAGLDDPHPRLVVRTFSISCSSTRWVR